MKCRENAENREELSKSCDLLNVTWVTKYKGTSVVGCVAHIVHFPTICKLEYVK
jgi:hypothetical protein